MSGFENIEQYDGVATSISGLCIVFFSLVLISIYITLLPRILEYVHKFLPESDYPDALAPQSAATQSAAAPLAQNESLQQVAAAAVAFHTAKGQG